MQHSHEVIATGCIHFSTEEIDSFLVFTLGFDSIFPKLNFLKTFFNNLLHPVADLATLSPPPGSRQFPEACCFNKPSPDTF